MSAFPTTNPQSTVDDVGPIPRPQVVLEPASPLPAVALPQGPSFISEQEVLLGTAAAVPLQPTRLWNRATGFVAAAMHALFMASPADSRPKRRHYPPRADYLEHSRMAREMHRL